MKSPLSSCNYGIRHSCSTARYMIPVATGSANKNGLCRWPVRFAAHKHPLCWNFLYHSRIVLSIGGSMWYMVRNLRCTFTIYSVFANSKTQNVSLSPVLAMFRHYCPLAVKPASTPRLLLPKQTWRDYQLIDMLPYATSVLLVALPSSEVPEGRMNYPV
jgi:hypothetical protein